MVLLSVVNTPTFFQASSQKVQIS